MKACGPERIFLAAQDEVVRVDLADRVAVLGEIEFDGSRGEPLFESADLGLADTAEFL